MSYWTMVLIFGILGAFVLQGLRRIPASPPHKGQKTWKGKRVEREVEVEVEGKIEKRIEGEWYDEGWGFYPFFPYLWGFILVKVERVTMEVVLDNTRTPDRAISRVPVSLTWRPVKELLSNYINSGQEKGVRDQLDGMVQEKVREWAMGDEHGPATWVELNGSHLEAVSVLVRTIAGKVLTNIPTYAQSVPTWIWLRYFSNPRPTRLLKNEIPWAEPIANNGEEHGWKKVRDVLINLTSAEEIELQKAVAARREEIEQLRRGSGEIEIHDLGIRLERLNIGDIEVLGKVGEQAEEEAKEEQERKADELELRFVRERIEELMKAPFNYSRGEARDIVQTERGKVVKAIDDKHITLDATTAEIVAKVLGGRK